MSNLIKKASVLMKDTEAFHYFEVGFEGVTKIEQRGEWFNVYNKDNQLTFSFHKEDLEDWNILYE